MPHDIPTYYGRKENLFWSECAVDEEKLDIPMVLYCSDIIYKYYYRIVFLPIKCNDEVKDIHN